MDPGRSGAAREGLAALGRRGAQAVGERHGEGGDAGGVGEEREGDLATPPWDEARQGNGITMRGELGVGVNDIEVIPAPPAYSICNSPHKLYRPASG